MLNLEVALMDPWMEQSYLKKVRCAGMYLRDGKVVCLRIRFKSLGVRGTRLNLGFS